MKNGSAYRILAQAGADTKADCMHKMSTYHKESFCNSTRNSADFCSNLAVKTGMSSSQVMTIGGAAYHEFADPYRMKLGMQGMSGTFDLAEEFGKNRAVFQGFVGYDYDQTTIYGRVYHFMNKQNSWNASVGFKMAF